LVIGLLICLGLLPVLSVCFYASQCVAAFRELSWAKMEDAVRQGKGILSLDETRNRVENLKTIVGLVRHLCEVAAVLILWCVTALLFEGSSVWALAIITGVFSVACLSLASFLLPAAFGAHMAEATAFGAVRAWGWLQWLGIATKRFNDGVDLVVARICDDVEPGSPEEKVSDEISEVVSDLELQGTIEEEAADMIESVLEFQDRDVAEVMTPRTEMVSIDTNRTLSEAVKLMMEKGHSRIPVTRENRDNVVGILYVKDTLNMITGGQQETVRISDIMREPLFVPEMKKIGDVLKEFQARKVHLAVVIDEYGGTAGLVTLEDILEEIVGEIQDEFDLDALPPLRMVAPGRAEATGKARIDKINEALGVELPEEEEYDTVNGMVNWKLGRVPKKGERFSIAAVDFTVVDADARLVKRLMLETGRAKPAQDAC